MKKLALPVLFLFMVLPLWAMPPMPGSGHTHDGSVFYDDEEPAALYAPALSSDNSSESSSAKYPITVSTTGNKTILVILAAFSDLAFNSGSATIPGTQTHDASYYSNLLQGASGLTMKQYYLQQSRDKLNLSFKVVGPYIADFGYSYYGANYAGIRSEDIRPGHLIYEMLNKAKPDVESSGVSLDNCSVIVIHAGPGEEESAASADCIWSHRSSLTKRNKSEGGGIPPVTIGGKAFDDYLVVPEYNVWRNTAAAKYEYEATIGVFCHEFGHVLGLQDAYDTSYATNGVGAWSLMGAGSWGTVGKAGKPSGSDPAPLMAWERLALGWIDEEIIDLDYSDSSTCSFKEMNSEEKVYTVKLTDNQFLLFEGKAQNMSGTGMCVPESGLLITQMHKGILSTYWGKNTINNGSSRPHGVMVMEAVAENYKENGLGNLWRAESTSNRFTTTALFRSGTLTSVGPSTKTETASIPFMPIFIDTIIASGVVIGMLAAWYAGRRKLCAVIAVAVTAVCISMGCTVYVDSGGGTKDAGPNTNYYTTTYNVHSKTGISGITISNIKCKSDGSGSFVIKKANYSSAE